MKTGKIKKTAEESTNSAAVLFKDSLYPLSLPVWYDDNKKYENQQKKDLSARRGKRVSGSDGQKT